MSDAGQEPTFTSDDDRFHLVGSGDPAIVEAVWWNFYVPEANLDAEIYLCFRPNLNIVYGGIYIFDDFCRHFIDLRYFDTRSYLPWPKGDLDDLALDNGLRMRALEPLSRYTVEYEGTRGSSLQLEFNALAPPVGFVSTPDDDDRANYAPGHFDQVGRMQGELRLDGERINIDCITHRDRSWGGIRKEDPGFPPDIDWQSAHFGEDLWLQCWLWHEDPVASDLQGGIVYKQGRPVRLAEAQRRTRYDATGTEARFINLWLRDVEGAEYQLQGVVRNIFPWPGWFNMVGLAGLVEWRHEGRVGWGEIHDGRTVDGLIAGRRAHRSTNVGPA